MLKILHYIAEETQVSSGLLQDFGVFFLCIYIENSLKLEMEVNLLIIEWF